MFACICRGVTEEEVHEHFDNGCRTLDDVGDRCGAGEGCGTCIERITEILGGRSATASSAA
ncbi:(2Fe-2S)-binding protein [Gordonia sp. ABSL1-1]|uniref:(2Fe-2S)-binding protein n=1 Tax=Gordonia sp. ABSL1-1 TaxID=3053923 RepID=UPI002573D5BD|nr:(2Fe-2S)-binding protein [Gordonia sp. ABSL1-1]MDL9937173.1 (2Fe-2S)-binding protein [Gordonia sp. ABSL1-1]